MLLTQVDSGDLLALITAYAIWNLGGAPLISLSMDLVVGSAPVERAGSAAALGETSSEFAFALGIAVLGSLGTAVYRMHVTGTPAAGFGDSLAGAVAAAPLNEAVILAAHSAFTDTMHVVAASSGLVLLAVAVLTLIGLRHLPRIGSKQAEEHASPPRRGAIAADVVPA
jgi:DHA2 family multidrug resistance protein-like MFS transporter